MDIHLAHSYMRADYNGVLEADYTREAHSRLAVEIMKAVNFYNYNNRDRESHDLYICGGGGGRADVCAPSSRNDEAHAPSGL